MKPRRLGSGPLIARLLGRHRQTVREAMRAGRFGQTVEHNGIQFADLATVERAARRRFTAANIEIAVDGRADRLLILEPQETA
jgi:IS30 family transposase